MTSVLSYPMSDPFASHSHQANLEAVARYSTPPLSPPHQQAHAPHPPHLAKPCPPSAHTPPPAQSGVRTPAASPHPDEFGAYPSVAGTYQSTSAARPRTSAAPTMPSPLPLPEPEASSSSSAVLPPPPQPAARSRQRQSHNPSATLNNASPPKPEYLTDEYVLHPSVYAYKQAHPRRPMVGFGPYVLLQTLGEGEFGKVKLGVHTEYGVEVAIKLIRRGSLDDEVRANKVEREIDVLKVLKHPNIVRMFDVIDTEKYIGIVLEFAGGGELFDHILANKYLKERDAQKLFAQLISGVDYLHKRHIVHRDLKLENLLLDKHRNIIITDFGFANRFDHAADDLMATSCGSPCYAAPELVVSEGLYVGSAVDIWSCGVILYAMLSGYLPYDDDPSNPDGDNINLLYKYIMSTKLNFPDHLSALAKDLLQIMLVPNPEYRCSIKDIMEHPWLYSHREIFQRSVEMNEYIFQENMYRKSQQAKRDLGERRRIQQEAKMAKAMMQRSQSSVPGTSVTASMLDARRTQRHHSALPTTNTIPDYLANAGRAPSFGHPLPSAPAPLPAKASPIIAVAAIMPTAPTVPVPLPPTFREPAIPPRARLAHTPTPSQGPEPSTVALKDEPMDVESQSERPPMSQNKNRHTIQVEYDGDASYEKMKEAYEAHTQHGSNASVSETPEETPAAIELLQATMSDIEMASGSESGHVKSNTAASLSLEGNMPDASQILTPAEVPFPAEGGMTQETNSKATVPDGQAQTDTPLTPRASTSVIREDILATPRAEAIPATAHKTSLRAQGKRFDSMPSPVAPLATTEPASKSAGLAPMGLPKVPPPKRDRYRKGMSLDKFGLAKLLGQATASSSIDVSRPPSAGGAAATLQQHAHAQNSATEAAKRTSMVRPRTGDSEVNKDKKSRRRTLQLITNRPGSSRHSGTPSTPATPATPGPLSTRDMIPASSAAATKGKTSPPLVIDSGGIQPQPTDRGQSSPSIVTVDAFTSQQAQGAPKSTASSNAARKVMDWFRRKSLAKDTLATLKAAGLKSDSASSFVRVEEPQAQEAPLQDAGAMSSASSIVHTAEGPSITVTEAEAPVPDSATLPKEPEPRVPLGSAANKANIPAPSGPATLPLATRSKSHNLPPPTQVPLSTTSTIPAKSSRSSGSPLPGLVQSPQTAARGDEHKLRVHTGLVDQSALSSKPPKEVMSEVLKVLLEMGMEVKRENEYRLRCTRVRRKKAGATTSLGLGSVMSVGSGMSPFALMNNASTSRTDSRGLPMPQSPSGLLSGGGLKGMLLRRGSSFAGQLPRAESEPQGLGTGMGLGSPSASLVGLSSPAPGSPLHEPLYGEHSVDNGDEVKFNVELCRIKNLPGLYLLNIKRLRGSVWSFKFIYQTLIERCETLTH